MLVFAFGLSNIGNQGDVAVPPAEAERVYELPSSNLATPLPENLQERMYLLENVYKQFSVKPMSIYKSEGEYPNGAFHLQLIKLGNHREELSLQEKGQIKEAIYKAVGSRFSLDITTLVIPKEEELVGYISELDKKDRKILLVNSEACLDKECKEPEKFWVSLEEYTVIVTNNNIASNKFEDLKQGDLLHVWTTQAVLLSSPPQYTALDIEVIEPEDESPVALSTLMKTDFNGIKQIDVRFGDGNKLAITDTKSLEEISFKLKRIELVRANDKRTFYGSLFGMELTIGDNKFHYGTSLSFDNIKYKQNSVTTELNDYIVALGRASIPNLLPGIQR
ncbi:YobA family protein [Paenibacillus andongensis]|uniref:YobA family protein n=1 Tax=Paenibacillus andongensis TaxID=2975482 RepID=UPI0021BBB3DC|nr:YobA family protein [Paenibacillus andongensis]